MKRNAEIELQNMKMKLNEITKEYTGSEETAGINLSEKQKRGIKKLRKRQKDREIVVFQTDKSGKLVVDTPENYVEAARPHVEKDDLVSIEEFRTTEKLINAHSVFWLKMLGVAKDSGDSSRFKMSMQSEGSQFATLYTYRKDHKPCEDRIKGPPVRPLCDVSDSYGHRLTHFISVILKEISDKEPTMCDSTEDMLAAIKEANETGKINENTVVGSLDVKALYPSLDLDFTIDVVADEFFHSDVKIDGVDYEELGLYLSLSRREEYLREKNIIDYCPRRRNKVGAPPKITGSGINVEKKDRFKPWIPPNNVPDEIVQRVMLKEALKIVLTVIMKNHIYCFNDELRKQKEGGAIGVDLTGELAKVFMCWWDKKMLKRMEEIGMDTALYKRYVDDVNIATEGIEIEYDYVDGALIVRSEQRRDNIEMDANTFDIIRRIGNEIHHSVQLTADVPSKNEERKVPILDLRCWTQEIEVRETQKWMVLHEHYVKDVSSKAVINREAALSMSSKRTILTQECLRIMLNCSIHLEEQVSAKHLTLYMARMEAAGYDKAFRFQVLRSAVSAYEKKLQMENTGTRPLYRKREWNRNERRREKEEKGKTWYRKGDKESVLFITATPNSELRERLQEEIDKSSFKIKVVEKSGTKVVRMLQKNDPFKTKECRDKERCMVCSGNNPGSCRDSGVTYRINCMGQHPEHQEEQCDSEYNGETGKNSYTRGNQHTTDLIAGKDSSVLWNHCVEKHDGVRQPFTMTVADKVRGDPMKRQILESIRISQVPEEKNLNRKGEWNSARLPRAIIIR